MEYEGIITDINDNRISFQDRGTFTVDPEKVNFLKKLKVGWRITYTATPDGFVTGFKLKPFDNKNKLTSDGSTGAQSLDYIREKAKRELKLSILEMLLATSQDAKIELIIHAHKLIQKEIFGIAVKGLDTKEVVKNE